MEWLDIVDENGEPTGKTVERSEAHAKGIRHRTAHVWLLRRRENGWEILLQRRSLQKASFPGCYDISSAGHIPAGRGYRESAVRELYEELGVTAREEELLFCGDREVVHDAVFFGKPFCDRQHSRVFCLPLDREESDFTLQTEEVDSVLWMPLSACRAAVQGNTLPHCIALSELAMVEQAVIRYHL